MIALASGQEVLGRAGAPSYRVTWQQVLETQPEVILLASCGYAQAQAAAEWASLPGPAEWAQLPAVQQGRVYVLDANSYCSRLAPRVVDGIEQLATLFHPESLPA